MISRCPKCKSDDLQETGKRLYWRRLAICLFVILLCGVVSYGLSEDDDFVIIIVGFVSVILTGVSIVLGIYYVVKALRTTQTLYHCKFCLNKFHTPLITGSGKPLPPLVQIRKRSAD